MIHLREYQEQALAALAEARRERPEENRQAVVMATGLGKTIVMGAEAAAEPGRTLALVHTDELATQAEAKIKLMAPGRSVGVVKAERNDVDAEIIVGSVQTLANFDRRKPIQGVDRIMVDECHHAVSTSYQDVLRFFGGLPDCGCLGGCWDCHGTGFTGPPTPVTGYTATLERGDGQSLGQVWHDVAFSRDISWAVRKGFLVPPVGYRVEVPGLAMPNTEQGMDNALVDSIAPERVVHAWLEHGQGRSTVLFAPLVKSAEAFKSAFWARGIEAAVIHGAMPKAQREGVLRAYERGAIQVLCNAMVLTEGWDSPRTECVIVARPTKSRPLFIQMAGRGLRRDPARPTEEQDCVLLVVANATTELRSIADLSDRPIKPEDGKSLLQLEDEFDLSTDLAPDPERHWTGEVVAREFDPLVARSSKVWNRTKGGTLYVPISKRGYVFTGLDVVGWYVAVASDRAAESGYVRRAVPDLELAMALAEDAATDLGGDIGKLYADKSRPWRKGRPTAAQIEQADRLGLTHEVDRIMMDRSAGKAGKVSDLISKVKASRRIDPVAARIKSRTGQR